MKYSSWYILLFITLRFGSVAYIRAHSFRSAMLWIAAHSKLLQTDNKFGITADLAAPSGGHTRCPLKSDSDVAALTTVVNYTIRFNTILFWIWNESLTGCKFMWIYRYCDFMRALFIHLFITATQSSNQTFSFVRKYLHNLQVQVMKSLTSNRRQFN